MGKYLFEEEDNSGRNYTTDPQNNYQQFNDTSAIYDSPSLNFYPQANFNHQLNQDMSANSNIRLSNYNLMGSTGPKPEENRSLDLSKDNIKIDLGNSVVREIRGKRRGPPVQRIVNYIATAANRAVPAVKQNSSSAFKKLNESDSSILAGINFKKIVEYDEEIVKPTPIILSTFDQKKRKRVRGEDDFDKINPKKSDLKKEAYLAENKGKIIYSRTEQKSNNNSFTSKLKK